ncbi:class I SAM-dependent rRNA methyltransferase [Alienimonas chondri]|uniref:class I SAM-dependent rRNA methyltransferase n=1 Tax=Alienimonas chondri TaxID=2681879 RepID=UPI0014889C94|nr:class I SAM-dependent rRNA methyltransferase [Alienimonas chondri]
MTHPASTSSSADGAPSRRVVVIGEEPVPPPPPFAAGATDSGPARPPLPAGDPATLGEPAARVVLKPRRAQPFHFRHPWVFDGAVQRIEAAGDFTTGSVADLVTDSGEWVARGLLHADANLKLRLYSWDQERPLDRGLFAERIASAASLRTRLFGAPTATDARRELFSEADGLTGLTVDRYGEYLTVQFTAGPLAAHQETVLDLLEAQFSPKGIFIRTEKGMGEAEAIHLTDGVVRGEAPPEGFAVEENGLSWGVDLAAGQKTGLYLDQRDNRRAAADLVAAATPGAKVLDLFCYSGGFGLTMLARGGATSVRGVDASESALGLAVMNAARHGSADACTWTNGKAFEVLDAMKASGERFDAVVCDPPKMTRTRKSVENALRGYHQLNASCLELLNPGGVLVTCCCSGLISREKFGQMLAGVAARVGRPLRILENRGAAPDHPTAPQVPESEYLKCLLCVAD